MTQSHKHAIPDTARILAHPPHTNTVSPTGLPIQPRLRPIRLLHHHHGLLRRTRTPDPLRLAHILAQRAPDVRHRRGRPPREPQRHARGVPVQHGDARARRGDAQRVVRELRGGARERPEDLARLRLELVLLAADERHHVVQDVQGGDARVAGAGDGLQGDDVGGVDGAEAGFERGEGDHQARDCAVGVAD